MPLLSVTNRGEREAVRAQELPIAVATNKRLLARGELQPEGDGGDGGATTNATEPLLMGNSQNRFD